MRFGTKNDDGEPSSNLRKVVIYKGTAVHSTSTDTRADLLNSKLSHTQASTALSC